MGVKANLAKKTAIFLTLAVLLAGCASRPPALKPPDYLPPPTAGICAEPSGEVVTVTVNPDIPNPRCSKVTDSQKLRVVNNTIETVQAKLGDFELSIEPGREATIDKSFGSYLEPGIHLITMSNLAGAAEIWLVGE